MSWYCLNGRRDRGFPTDYYGRERNCHNKYKPKVIAKQSIASFLLLVSVVHDVSRVVLNELPLITTPFYVGGDNSRSTYVKMICNAK